MTRRLHRGALEAASYPPRLTWAPPALSSPTTITIADDGSNRTQNLSTALDYIIKIGNYAEGSGLGISIKGGRNIVIVGGAITATSAANFPTGITFDGPSGTVHMEGVNFTGTYIGDCVRIQDTSALMTNNTVIQIQNCRLVSQVAPGKLISDGHPDAIQVQSDCNCEIRLDRVTARFAYQGFTCGSTNGAFTERLQRGWKLKNVNGIFFDDGRGEPHNTFFYQEWRGSGTFTLDPGTVWCAPIGAQIEAQVYPDFFGGRNAIDPANRTERTHRATDAIGAYCYWSAFAQMDPVGLNAAGGWTDQGAGATNLNLAIDDYLGKTDQQMNSPGVPLLAQDADTTYAQGPVNTTNADLWVDLGDVPATLTSPNVTQIAIRKAYKKVVATGADTINLEFQIFKADKVTAISAAAVKNAIGTAYVEDTDTVAIQGTPTNAEWNGALLRIRQTWTSAGGTGSRARVTAAAVFVDYTDDPSPSFPSLTGVGTGKVYEGTPPGGDYCPSNVPGSSYITPGYGL